MSDTEYDGLDYQTYNNVELSDTPRTDSVLAGLPSIEHMEIATLARQLERELLGAREEIALYEGTLKNREESIDYLRAQIITGASAEAISPANPSAGTAHLPPNITYTGPAIEWTPYVRRIKNTMIYSDSLAGGLWRFPQEDETPEKDS